ncbi:MAG TPA: glycosyltransferase family 39 protein [Verrucomicrobiae bacterium]|nr:glycosyltransferase family 39 protein [Verrucomicrobiae bacterium]
MRPALPEAPPKTGGLRSLPAALAVYAALAVVFNIANRYQINWDGVRYLSFARLLAHGRWWDSVDVRRPPLLSWLLAPLVESPVFRGEALFAARAAMAVSGAAALAAAAFLARRFQLRESSRFAALLFFALLFAHGSAQITTPDLLLCALIWAYLYFLCGERFLDDPRLAALAGLTAGAAYLAKQYAFPFFCVHYPLFLMLKAAEAEDKKARAKAVRAFLIGLGAFLLPALPYVIAFSIKLGRFTFGCSGSGAHLGVAPPDFIGGYGEDWSPFHSWEYFAWQASLCREAFFYFLQSVCSRGPLLLMSFLALPVLVAHQRKNRGIFFYKILLLTAVVYTGGYLFVPSYEERFFLPVLVPMILFTFKGWEVSAAYLARPLWLLLSAALFLSLAFPPLAALYHDVPRLFQRQTNPYRKIAETARELGGGATEAACSRKAMHASVYVLFYLDLPGNAIKHCGEPEDLAAELEKNKSGKLLLFYGDVDPKGRLMSQKLRGDSRFRLYKTVSAETLWDGQADIFEFRPEKVS